MSALGGSRALVGPAQAYRPALAPVLAGARSAGWLCSHKQAAFGHERAMTRAQRIALASRRRQGPSRTAVPADAAENFTAAAPPPSPARPRRGPLYTLLALFRAVTMAVLALVSVIAFIPPLLLLYLPDGLFSRHPHRFAEVINRWWAAISTWPLLRLSVSGLEKLGRPGQGKQGASSAATPAPAHPPSTVYVCNHSSALDIFIALRALPGFKFISKSSVFLIPFIGWAMFLTGHVRLRRSDRQSQVACLKECARLLRRGSSLLLFPEGTRSRDGRLQPYKKGAFSLAAKAGCSVVPVSIRGAASLLPRGAPWLFFPGAVDVVVHDPIPPGDPEKMAEQAWKVTHAALVGEVGV